METHNIAQVKYSKFTFEMIESVSHEIRNVLQQKWKSKKQLSLAISAFDPSIQFVNIWKCMSNNNLLIPSHFKCIFQKVIQCNLKFRVHCWIYTLKTACDDDHVRWCRAFVGLVIVDLVMFSAIHILMWLFTIGLARARHLLFNTNSHRFDWLPVSVYPLSVATHAILTSEHYCPSWFA